MAAKSKSAPAAKSKAASAKAAAAPAKGKTPPAKGNTAAKVNKTTTASGGGRVGKAGATPKHAPLPRRSPKTQRGN